jgi:hypothetical protein
MSHHTAQVVILVASSVQFVALVVVCINVWRITRNLKALDEYRRRRL